MNLKLDLGLGFRFGGRGGTFRWWGGGTFRLSPRRHFSMSGPCLQRTSALLR